MQNSMAVKTKQNKMVFHMVEIFTNKENESKIQSIKMFSKYMDLRLISTQ
jgi:hypothetical protein